MSVPEFFESGARPGRFEFVREPTYFEVPSDPDWNRFSDVILEFTAGAGASYAAQNATGDADAQDHFRGQEDPELTVGYPLQQELVDGSGNSVDPATDGILRDDQTQLEATHLVVHRMELPGGNDGAGVRKYTVARGGKIASVEAELAPDDEMPIPMTLDYAPRKIRSYLIHQPAASTTVDVVSTDSNDTMDVTIENEGAGNTETITLNGTTTVTSTVSVGNIDAVWLSDPPEGDVTLTDGSGTTLTTIYGGLTYSDDSQPVDGDRGIPPLGAGSHASAIGTDYEHFVGDRVERPAGTAIRDVITGGSWTIDNDIDTTAVHSTRQPVTAVGNRTVSVETDVSGETVSHENFVDSLKKDQADIEHELASSLVTFKNTVPADVDPRSIEPEEARAEYSVTWEASGSPAIEVTQP